MSGEVSVRVVGTGSYLPERVATNEEIAPRMNSTAEWILSHTGIESRHIAAPEECSSSMGAEACRRALESAGVSPDEVGLVLCATSTPDYQNYPSNACLVQARIGCSGAGAMDVAAACSGFVYGLEMARCYLKCHPGRKALVVGADVLSRCVDFADRSVSMLFGDGAGAVLLESVAEADSGFSRSILGADGAGADLIYHEGGFRRPLVADPLKETPGKTDVTFMCMQGHAVFNFAVRKLDRIVRDLCADAEMAVSDLDMIFPHQANARILDAVARRMGLSPEKIFKNLATTGNTSTASIPLCLDQAVRSGVLKDGMRIAMAGFGAGLTWAGALMKWPFV